jgi:two-component system, LytTR family, response regulator
MIRVLIIDDEIHCVKSLMWDLHEAAPQIEVVGSAASGAEGIEMIAAHSPDLIFLDISMPGMNGFEMLEQLPSIPFKVIFTTAHDQYAAKAFRKSAVDFLVKPIDRKDLLEAIEKVAGASKTEKTGGIVSNLLQNYRKPEAKQRIALPLRDGYEFAIPQEIIYLEAEGSYTKIFFTDKKHLLVSRSIGDIAEMLPDDLFVRIHHSYIVNIESVTHFLRTDGGFVQLKNGTKLLVSKSKKNEVMDRLGLK